MSSELERTNPQLARSLMNLAIAQNMLGRAAEALPNIERAVEIRRILARDNPDGNLVFLARSLTELSSCLVNDTRPDEAIGPGQESVDIRRRLAETNPERHIGDLARSLHQTATAHHDAGNSSQALACYEEAISTRRDLVTRHPSNDAQTALAESLACLAALQLTVQHPAAALPLAQEAARLIEWRTDAQPENLRPVAKQLTTVLISVANVLDANEHTHEAQALRREIAALQNSDTGTETAGGTD
ncbi:tetratricopeptide repeat protein [Promicromonospora sp. NPDC019610]|uniref:tetratricopeptide repeat protein n=1 Tax=Promicromonospora sp. NPDC019610 TaxID=3364405 RepID=UPI0037A44170